MESFNTEDFISEIKAQPAIWNSATEEYSNKICKRNAWEEVILKFHPLFNEKTTGEKNNISKLMQFIVVFQAFTEGICQIAFWVLTPCSIVSWHRRFGVSCCLHLQSDGNIFLQRSVSSHDPTVSKPRIFVILFVLSIVLHSFNISIRYYSTYNTLALHQLQNNLCTDYEYYCQFLYPVVGQLACHFKP